jgi:MFS family permease
MNTAEDAFGMAVKLPEKIDIWGAVAAIATISSVGVAVGLSFPLLSFLMEQRGYSTTLIGANTAMAGIASMLVVPFVNPVARRIGLVNTLVLAAIVSAASLMGFYLFPSIGAWFALRISFHGAITASFILSEYWINVAAPEKRRGLVLGIYGSVLSLGFAMGPTLLALLGSKGALPFVTGVIIILVSTVPAILANGRQPRTDSHPTSRSVVRYIWLVPLATAAAFIFGAVEQAGLALFPVYGARNGYDETQISLLLIVLAFGNVALQLPLGLISDRLRDRRWLLFSCAAVGAVGVAIVPYAMHYPLLLICGMFIWGGVTTGMYTVGLAHLGSRLKGPDLAQANAAFILCYAIGMVIGPYVAGVAMDIWNPHGFAVALSGMFAGYLVLVLVRRKPPSL